MILIVSFSSLRILIFFFLFDISLSLITWVVSHAGSLLRRTAPLIFRGQIGLALEKTAKTNFHLEDGRWNFFFSTFLNSIKISLSMFLPGPHPVRLHFAFSVFSFGISRHLTFASVSPRYGDLDNFGSTGANAVGSFPRKSIHGKSI